MSSFNREVMLLAPVVRYMNGKGYTSIEKELQFYECRIDLYGFSRKQGLTMAIELKLVKWRKALRQALRYQLCADLVYLAVPRETVQRVDLGQLEEHGIGLISVCPQRCRQIIPATKTPLVRPHYRDFYVDYLSLQS